MYRKPRARLSRWLAPISVGASLVALTVAACSVPEFEFPPPPVQGVAGDGGGVVTPPDPCENKLLDADSGETDFDCGGACAPCGVGQHCADAPDCQAELLCHEGTCIGPGCMNGAQDGGETDEDCGGETCMPCITGQACSLARDCESGVCGDAVCLPAACDDQVTNGKETGLDCGGDCSPCPANEPCLNAKDCISNECNDKICGSECQDGFANCDKQNDNACEVSIKTDLANCGFCGNVCDLPNATAECSSGACRIATDGCAAGFQDCNGDPADGCEVNLKTNKLNCGSCNKICPDLNGDPSCVAGLCEITCTTGFEDCDDKRDNGCEINTATNSKNCGVCAKVCPAAAGYSAYCKASECGQTLCAAGKGDCNGDPVDGCETTTSNDVNNCGGCGVKCEAVNANVACVNSQCVISSCQGSYADCDKATANGFKTGCEVDTNLDTNHCGGCGKLCTIANGTPKCDAGSCEIKTCSGTYDDCDGDPKTGCEVNLALNTKNCGGCGANGKDCGTYYPHATSTCSGSACVAPTCAANYAHCTGPITNGCETNTSSDSGNCGGCGTVCETAGAHVTSNDCVSGQCDPKCSGVYLSCDGKKPNGCEADSSTDENNCNACGTICSSAASAHVVSNDCLSGGCNPVCSGTYKDCDTSRTNGCEVDTATSASNCGGCGTAFACSTAAAAHVTTNACSGSACNPVCNGLYDDCDASRFNGCEKDVSADVNNCGSCGAVCGKLHASGGTACGTGKCNPSCDTGWAKCTATDTSGCSTQLGTTSNCSKCAEACSGGTPFCDPGGCVDHRDIVVVNSGSATPGGATQWHNVAGWASDANVPTEIKLKHTLQTAKGNNRMIVVGLAATDTLLTDPLAVTVTYNTQPMQLAVYQQDTNPTKQSYAAVYYMLDAALPDNAGAYDVVATYTTPGYRWGHAGMDLIELRNTTQAAPLATAGSPGNTGCGSGSTRSATVSFSQTGSLVYGVLGARGGSAATLSAATGLVETWNQYQATPDKMIGAAAYVPSNGNRTITWTVVNCYNSATAIVAIKRLNWN